MADTAEPQESLSPTLVNSSSEARVDLDAPPLEQLGDRPRYEHGATIGRGGMGEVNLCRDVVLNRQLAMKRVSSTSPGTVARFVREARVQGQLEHPGVVPVHDLGLGADGRPFFTMKRVRGATLEEIVRDLADGEPTTVAKYPRRRLLTVFQQVCLTVDFAHARGVIHRDLKPANVMVGDYGEVYVLDWGLAKRLGGRPTNEFSLSELETLDGGAGAPASDGATKVGAVMGTPGYMAPEQVRGEAVDARADLFSLGSIFFELLTLQRLVPGGDVTAVLRHTLTALDPRARERAPQREVPPELEAACVKACAADPAQRYATARELHDAVDAFLAGERDEELRSGLAERHLAAARAAARSGTAETHRDALRELGQALTIAPGNPEAMRLLVGLFGATRGELPAEARRELDEARAEQLKVGGRWGAYAYLTLFFYLPLLLWMGVRDGRLLFGMYALVLLSAGASWAVGRMPAPRPWLAFAPYLASTLLIGWLSFALGPFIFLPSFAATNTIAFTVLLDAKHRAYGLALGAGGVVLPLLAYALGLVPDPHSFSAGGLTIAPQMLELTALPTMVLLTTSSVGTIVIAALAVSKLRDALRDAEQRLVAQSWTLRQLLPPEATAAASSHDTLPPVVR